MAVASILVKIAVKMFHSFFTRTIFCVPVGTMTIMETKFSETKTPTVGPINLSVVVSLV